MDLLKVALRNVGRNTRRSLITALTVFIGVVVVCGTRGLLNGLQGEIRGGLTQKIHGDLQLHLEGYRDVIDANPYKIVFPYSSNLQDALLKVPAVKAISPRLRIMGLLNHQKSQTSTPVMITGINSAQELAVCPRLIDAIQAGTLLDSNKEKNQSLTVDDGDDLGAAPSLDETDDDPSNIVAVNANESFHQIMITPALMRGLDAELGDEIVILIQDQDNMQQAIVTRITAVVDYALPTAVSRMAWMDFTTLQNLSRTRGEASEVAIRKKNEFSLEAARTAIAKVIEKGIITETWLQLSGFLADVLGLQDIIFSTVVAVVFSIVISAIVNTSLMTVMERTREIGTLSALGYRRKHIMFLFLAESAAISLTGGVIGALVAAGIITAIGAHGLEFALPGQQTPVILYPYITLPFISLALGLAFVSAFISAFFPSYRASRMKPVEALTNA